MDRKPTEEDYVDLAEGIASSPTEKDTQYGLLARLYLDWKARAEKAEAKLKRKDAALAKLAAALETAAGGDVKTALLALDILSKELDEADE